jgi:hypothetical protein
MAKLSPLAIFIVLISVHYPFTACAAADDAASLRAELDRMKGDYAARIGALESRIAQLESAAATAATAAPVAAPVGPAPVVAAAKTSSASAFTPAISMILAGNYASLSEDPATYRIAGFIPTPSGAGPGERSVNLGESEWTVASNVDPYFFANVTAAIHGDDSISVEEAYF